MSNVVFFGLKETEWRSLLELERISDDGSSFVEPQRWPEKSGNIIVSRFLRGLFFIDPGHYRIIVFIFRDRPFSQSSQIITRRWARGWLLQRCQYVVARNREGACLAAGIAPCWSMNLLAMAGPYGW